MPSVSNFPRIIDVFEENLIAESSYNSAPAFDFFEFLFRSTLKNLYSYLYLSIDRFYFIRIFRVISAILYFTHELYEFFIHIYEFMIFHNQININDSSISISKNIISSINSNNHIILFYYLPQNFRRILKRDSRMPRKRLIDISISLIPLVESIRESTSFHFIAKRSLDKLICHCHGSRHAHNLTVYHEPRTRVCIVMRRHRVAATRNGHDESQSATGINPEVAIYQPGLSPFPS